MYETSPATEAVQEQAERRHQQADRQPRWEQSQCRLRPERQEVARTTPAEGHLHHWRQESGALEGRKE